jgi:hypothetical protein
MSNSIAIGVAYQDQAISGGTIDNTPIGATTPSTGVFSSLGVSTGTVAATGSSNTDAASLGYGFNLVTGADATKGVILPNAASGTIIFVKNSSASALKVYPDSGAAINALTATTGAYSMAANTTSTLIAYGTSQWYSLPLVAS